jgi:hypothetical protein
MLKHWLTCIRNKDKKLIFVGVAAAMWAIWCTRNDLIFPNKQFHSFMHAIFRGAYWLWFWSLLQRDDTREIIRSASKTLEVVANLALCCCRGGNKFPFSKKIQDVL